MAPQIKAQVKLFGLTVPGLTHDISITDPALAYMLQFGMGNLGSWGIYQALQSPAFYRGVALICGTIATLPLKTYKNVDTDEDNDARVESKSFLDLTPAAPFQMTTFAWKRQVTFYLVTEGGVGLIHNYNNGGALIGLMPVAPSQYTRELVNGRMLYKVRMQGEPNPRPFDQDDFTQILGLTLDGMNPISPVVLFQRGIQLSQAQEIAAMRTMTNGMMNGGLVTADEDLSETDTVAIMQGLRDSVTGPDKAGGLAFINRKLKITPWTQTNTDAQFIEGRRFSREDVALMLGLPIYMLNPEKQTSWGTGVAEQNLGLSRYTLMTYTSPIEEGVSSAVRPSTKFVEFDYKGLLQGTPEVEVKLILQQVDAGLISEEEGRDLLGFGPKDPKDTFRVPAAVPPSGKLPEIPQPAGAPAGSNGSAK